jgi:hypothetical protein
MLLHSENLQRIPVIASIIVRRLETRIVEMLQATEGVADPDLTVVVRSRNNLEQLRRLLHDLSCQRFGGNVELIILDTSSSDGSADLAKKNAAQFISIPQDEYSHPTALNLAFARAQSPWILSLVSHSSLAHIYTLKVATRCATMNRVLGAAGVTLPDSGSTRTERFGSLPVVAHTLKQRTHAIQKDGMGVFAMNSAVVNKTLWENLGGFDIAFGGGGEDGAMCRSALSAGYQVLSEPAMSVYHSHGLGPINSARQLWHWAHMGTPTEFSLNRLLRYRTDLRSQ